MGFQTKKWRSHFFIQHEKGIKPCWKQGFMPIFSINPQKADSHAKRANRLFGGLSSRGTYQTIKWR